MQTFKVAPKVAVDNFNDFIVSVPEDILKKAKITEDKSMIVISWNKNSRTVFFENGDWELYEAVGKYPSGKLHHIQKIKI